MAPYDIYGYGPFALTRVTSTGIVYANNIGYIQRKVETKKERIKRIAKEKMYASWKTFNQKTPTIIEIIQTCKPKHIAYLKTLNHANERSSSYGWRNRRNNKYY